MERALIVDEFALDDDDTHGAISSNRRTQRCHACCISVRICPAAIARWLCAFFTSFASDATVAASAGETLAREAVRATQDEANNALLLEKMRDVEDRRANFACTLVAIRSANDPSPLVAVGRWNGEILRKREGEGGFGYDPLMFIPAFGLTVASLAKDVKNAHSHRAIAAGQMKLLMQQAWHL